MNPNHQKWFDRCFETIFYLHELGLDYIELDQFTYQRNFFDDGEPLAMGYKRMIDVCIENDIRFWLEGVSDIFRLDSGNFYQILIRDRAQLWDDQENRRGYPYGQTHAPFFMSLYPDSEVSYQIFTEQKPFDLIPERFAAANQIGASVYDMELGFYDEHYMNNLKRIVQILQDHGHID